MTGAHICSECLRPHETVPACAGCGDWFENQTWWFQTGQQLGENVAGLRFQGEREQFQREIVRLGGDISARVVKAAQGPSFPQLCDIRGESDRATAHNVKHSQIVDRLRSVGGGV